MRSRYNGTLPKHLNDSLGPPGTSAEKIIPLPACGVRRPRTVSRVPPDMIPGYGSSEEHRPIAWIGGYALFAAHMIVVVFVATMILTAILMWAGAGSILNLLPFTSADVLRGQVWRVFTYGLVNPPSLWFAIDMLMIVWFGRELEKFFGRRTFLTLFGCLYFLSPLLLSVVGLVRPTHLAGQTGGFALFIAFATLYPNVALLFNLLAKWVAIILVGLYSLMALSANNNVQLLTLWATTGFAFAFVRHQQGHFTLPSFKVPQREPKLRVLPDATSKPVPPRKVVREDPMAEIDALLDKIARSGISSLTAKERAKLEAARDDLQKRSSSRS